ncbi:hypothetical protein ABNM62_18980 [Pseudomonas syringae]
MSNGMAFFDEHGEPAAVAFTTLQALGITDPAVEVALIKLAQLAFAKS